MEKGDESTPPQKEAETPSTPEDSSHPAQVEEQPSTTSPTPDTPVPHHHSNTTGDNSGDTSNTDTGVVDSEHTEQSSDKHREEKGGEGTLGETPPEALTDSAGDSPPEGVDSVDGQGGADSSGQDSDQQTPDKDSSVTSSAAPEQDQASGQSAVGDSEPSPVSSAPVDGNQTGIETAEPDTTAPEQTPQGAEQSSVIQDSLESSVQKETSSSSAEGSVPQEGEASAPEVATDLQQSKEATAESSPSATVEPPPCEDGGVTDTKKEDLPQDSTLSPNAGVEAEASEELAGVGREDRSAVSEIVGGEDNTDQTVETAETAVESSEVISALQGESTPIEAAGKCEQENQDQTTESTRVSEPADKTDTSEQPPESQDQGEEGDLLQASSFIVQESITKAINVLSEESPTSGEGTQNNTVAEAAEPSLDEPDTPSEVQDSADITNQDLTGSDHEESLKSPKSATKKESKTEEELGSAESSSGTAQDQIKESCPVTPTSSSESPPPPDKETGLQNEHPKEEKSTEITVADSEPCVDQSQQAQASDTGRDKPVTPEDYPADTEEKTSLGSSEQPEKVTPTEQPEKVTPTEVPEKVTPADQAEKVTPTEQPAPPSKPSAGSDGVSLSSSGSSNASSLTKTKKKGHRKRKSSDRKVTFKSPEPPSPDTMGAGTSRDGEMEDADPRFAAQSTAAMSTTSGYNAASPPRSPGRGKNASFSQQSSVKSSGHMSNARASRFNMDGFEDAEVHISSDGFNVQEVTIMEGQMVRFVCDQSCPNNATLLQVIYDGDELRPVIGGFQVTLDDHHGVFQQQLNLEGEYKFALSGIRCTPLMVRVRRKTDFQADVTDEGFLPELIYIDQGSTIRWTWKQTAVPHTISEVNYVYDKGCLNRQPASQSIVATTSGTHRQTFNRPGLYYFRTEGAEPGKAHLCIVCVHAVTREYRIEILDRSFQPMILLIEEGDRVWFSWDRFKCKKSHSVYQIEAPGTNHNEDDAYEPAQDGFKWTTPSKQGLMSYRFDKVGVFYFSDQNFEEAAEYIGTIIVKPKQREHVVKLQESGFSPDLIRVMTGDRVWWVWDGPAIAEVGESLLLLEEDKVLNPLSRKNNSAEQSEHYQDLDAAASQLLTRAGASTINFTTVGVYTYKLSDVGDTFNSCSVLVNPGSKNHTVHLTDNGFEPKVITLNCNDRVWWVWQSGKRQHNVIQVSHQGLPIPGGFCSGQPRDSPSAFAHQFSIPGVYYFISKALPQVFGAVVVSTRPQVHEVMVKESGLRPDPVTIQLNDVVAWVFGSPRQFDITMVQSVDQVLDAGTTHKAVAPRRCFGRGISQTGTFHFKSKSFQKKKETNFMEETRLSSVVCDDRSDSIIIQLDRKGFHPSKVYLQKGQSLLWSWKGTDEEHNIIHVTDPGSSTPLNMIKGPRAFNSGRPLPNDSFLYTFDEDGSYTVVSQGAPGFSCTVYVMEVARRTGEPYVSSEQTGGTVDRYTRIHLASKTAGAKIYYTLDGSCPSINSKLYRPEKGITLRQSGLNFVRAVAAADQYLQSHIFTSSRFWVLSKGDEDQKSDTSVSDQEMTVPPQTKTWDWWSSKPQIKGCFTSPGTLEVFWDAPEAAVKKQIRSFQIFLNGVSYCQKFPSSTNSLKLVGLAGGRKYGVMVEVYPQHAKNQVVESNMLQMVCPKVAPPGGPVISLETTADPQTLSVVWMSIDSAQHPIDGYLVYLNDQQCGPKLVPESGSNRCKVVVSGCDTATDYKLYVLAVSADTDETLMSNVLVVQLPLDTSNINLPPPDERGEDEDVYLEYIEVLEGSGYLPQMDEPKNKGGKGGGLKKTPAPAQSETETETESDSETDSTETDSETESDTDSEPLPEARRLKQQGAVKLGASVTDGVQQASAPKKVVEVETGDLPEDCACLPVSKSSLRSFSDLDAYHYEQSSRSDLADNEHSRGEISSSSTRKHVSFYGIAHSVCQLLKEKKRAHRQRETRKQGDWEAVRGSLTEEKRGPDGHGRQGVRKGEGQELRSVLKTRPSQESMQSSPAPVPKHGSHLRVEDARQRRAERFTRSHSEETYEDSEPRHRPSYRLQRGHSDSFDDYEDQPIRRRDWMPPAGTPRYGVRRQDSYREEMTPRYDSYRQDSYRDEASDYSEGTIHQHSISSGPLYHRRGRGGGMHHFDHSPDRYSHSSYSSQRRHVSFKDREELGYHGDGSHDGDGSRSGAHGFHFEPRGARHQDSVEMYKLNQRREYQEPSQRRMKRPGRQKSVHHSQQIYRETLDSDTASDRDSVEHLYISPRYAERLDDHRSSRKSVQFYLSPAENEIDPRDHRQRNGFSPGSKSGRRIRDDESVDNQLSDGETIVAEDDHQQYVVHEPYGDVPVYGRERDPSPPPLPAASEGMLSRFLNIVNHVPFIREDLMDSGVEDREDFRSDHQDFQSEQHPVSETENEFHPQPDSIHTRSDYQDSERVDVTDTPDVHAAKRTKNSWGSRAYPDARKKDMDTSTPRIGGLVDDDTTSESESESESDYESDTEQPPGGHVVILDASKNQATDTKQNLKGRAVGEKGHYREVDRMSGMAVVGHGARSSKKGRGKATALIEVQKTVALDMDERHVRDTGDIMEKTKLAVSTEQKSMIQVKEGELVTGDGDGILPAPSIMATTKGKHSVRVAWELPREADPQYKMQLFVVNVVGTKFSSEINSDISYECNLVEKGRQVRGVQHCWNIHDKQQCVIKGLQPGLTYRIYVICNYSTVRGNKPCEIQTTSSVLYYTTMGPPKSPKLKVVRVDLYQACIAWEAPAMHENARLSGYQIQVDGKPLGGLRNPDIEQMVINNLVPGKTISINVVAVMARAAQESAPSKTIHITCPRRPAAPTISQQPSYKRGCVLLAWDKPRGHPDTTEETITAYSIYVDGQWHGEVKASRMGDQQGYQFFLTDLAPEQSYDVSVKAIAGDRSSDPDAQHVYCLSESFMSNIVPVMAPAAPKSPKLRLEGLHPDGIDVTWQTPQQSGDAHISGYQMLKNGKLYGSIIPSDVNSLRIRDISLGEKLTLQLIALTEHPVGKGDARVANADKDSGISGSTAQQDDRSAVTSPTGLRDSQKTVTFTRHININDWPTSDLDVFAGERYSGCKPGPKLVVHYTGLVCPPSEVWCERVTGHSALIVWNKAEERKAHYVSADSYQVTWWPGDRPHDEINSDSTTDDHLLITSLRPATTYTVVVEARKMEKYTDMDEAVSAAETPEGLNAFILSSKSEHLTVKTACPPDPPRNVGISATTCNSLNVAWDPPQEHGSEVIAIRIECISLNAQDPHHVTEDIMPDSTSADIMGLHEKTDYLVRVVAVTEEYFDRLPDKHKHKKLHAIPRDVLVAQEESPWLPSASIVAKTAGTEAPANIRLTQSTMTSLVLTWTPPLVYGSNKLLSQIVRWRDVRRTKPTDPEDLIVASHVNLLPTEDTLTISDLVPGSQYQIVIEAVVSIKTSLNPDQWDSGIEKFRRTAHVMSKPLVVWTRAPIEPPRLLVQSYDMSSAILYWEKPILVSIIGKDEEGNPRYLRRYLEGYRLEINGKVQSCLGPQAQTCTLTKCKPGKQYSVVLVAMTCTEDRRRERKEKFKGYFKTTAPQDTDYVGLLDDELLDEAPSEPVEVTLPKSQDGFMETVKTGFIHQEERDSRTFGDVEVMWTVQGQSNLLKQFSIVWFSSEDRVVQTKYVGPEKRRATIPVTHLKSIYTITVEPCYYTEVLPQQPQDVHCMVPGPPDAPEIFLRSQDKEEFVIEWGEPRCFGGVKVKGYQVYMNEKKVGNELSNSHRKAVIPCRMNRMYRINLVALSSNPDYQDSPKSNTLLINSGKGPVGQGDLSMEDTSMDDHDLPVKVTGVTESGIHLDWSAFVENQEVAFYKIQWSSVAQPAQREVRLSPKDISCIINKCLPGTTHFVRLLAYSEGGQIIEKSKQLTVQTSAPPDAPVLSVRACNFRYIAIQWDKPTTYGDALITGYKVYVNGIVEAVLSADSLSFTFTQGKWCQEYSFQVQALTAGDQLNSKPSEPLILTWPGTKAPQIKRIPAVSSSSLRVSWTAPHLTDGVRVKHFKLCCVEEDTEKLVQSVGPIHPDTCEAEFKHLKKGNYMVYLETHLYGTGEIVRSDPIRMQPSVCPDPPQISVTVVGLEERRQLEKLTCDLANKRDRLIRAVGHKLKRIGALAHPLRAEKDDDVVLGAHTLTGVEELLENCFQALENYTGQLIAHVSWQCPQTNEDIHLSGFKVLVDGKQYGSSMHAGVRTVRLQLGLEEPSYGLSMVSLSDKPQGSSVESSTVELLSAPFRPFSYYCYHTIHTKGSKWPSQGCCKYQDSLSYERQVGKKLANQGLLTKHVPPPACSLLDIFAGDYKPLMKGHRPHCPTVLLFWTPWCLSASKMMDFYIRFAREASKEFNFIAVACGVTGIAADDRQTLVHQLTSGGWREDGVMWHCTSECASNVYRTLSTINQTTSSLRLEQDLVSEKYMDLTELLGIAGVPTFLFIHPEGYIAWHGRYSSFDYAAFNAFMRHTNSEVMRHPCPVFNCDCCKNDMSIDQEAIAALLPERARTAPQPVVIKTASPNNSETNLQSAAASRSDLKYAAINGFTENASGTDHVFMARKPSPKRRTKLSINRRPYSASATPQQLQGSPYLAKVVPSAPQTRSRNRPVSAKTVHYM